MIHGTDARDLALIVAGLLFVIGMLSLAAALTWIGVRLVWRRLNGDD